MAHDVDQVVRFDRGERAMLRFDVIEDFTGSSLQLNVGDPAVTGLAPDETYLIRKTTADADFTVTWDEPTDTGLVSVELSQADGVSIGRYGHHHYKLWLLDGGGPAVLAKGRVWVE